MSHKLVRLGLWGDEVRPLIGRLTVSEIEEAFRELAIITPESEPERQFQIVTGQSGVEQFNRAMEQEINHQLAQMGEIEIIEYLDTL